MERQREGREGMRGAQGKPVFGGKDAGYHCVEKEGCTSWAVGEEKEESSSKDFCMKGNETEESDRRQERKPAKRGPPFLSRYSDKLL